MAPRTQKKLLKARAYIKLSIAMTLRVELFFLPLSKISLNGQILTAEPSRFQGTRPVNQLVLIYTLLIQDLFYWISGHLLTQKSVR